MAKNELLPASPAWRSGARRMVRWPIAVVVLLPCACLAAAAVLTEMPKEGEVRAGKVVYVDDGKCPPGEITEVVGGDRQQGTRRQVRCVKRPN